MLGLSSLASHAFKVFLLTLLLYGLPMSLARAESVGGMLESFGDSIGQGLDNLGQELNNVNSAITGNPAPQSYEAQIRQWRQLEAAKVKEFSEVTGVGQEHLRELRAEGMTWEQIAQKYNVNLNELPAPQPAQ